jgi:methylated-DNA-protein-cysteine methyltransferase related protein
VVRRIPAGRVMTYGQVARGAGLPNGARLAGYAMAVAPAGLPWQRVIAKSRPGYGRISIRDSQTAEIQRQFLENEGIEFTPRGEIDLERFAWQVYLGGTP